MFKSCYEVVSVSKENNEVVFRNTEWVNKDELIDKIESDYTGFEIVRVFKVERSRNITVKTNKEFTVGQKFSNNDFYALALNFHNSVIKGCGETMYGEFSETGNTIGGNIENRVVYYDTESGRVSEKIEIDEVKKMIGFLSKMVESAK